MSRPIIDVISNKGGNPRAEQRVVDHLARRMTRETKSLRNSTLLMRNTAQGIGEGLRRPKSSSLSSL
jgi:hypothetical protein